MFGIQYNSSSIPPWYEGSQQKKVELSDAEMQRDYVPYQGQRLQPFSDDTQNAFGMVRNNVGAYKPYLDQAFEGMNKAMGSFPQAYQSYMNPYKDQVLDNIGYYGNRNFRDNIMPMLEGQFVGLGQFGSGRHQKALSDIAARVQGDISRQQGDYLAQGYNQAGQMFNADRGRMMQGAMGLADLGKYAQGAGLADAAALVEQGKQQQQFGQMGLDVDYQNFQNKLNHPRNQIAHHTAALQGILLPEQRAAVNYQQQPQVNTAGQLGGLAASLYGARMAGGY